MNILAECPTVDAYRQLLAGRLDSDHQQPLLSHLEECKSCTDTIESVLKLDTLFDAARVTHSHAETVPDGLIDRLLTLTAEDVLHGRTQIGPYLIRGRLGQGGMGIVYLADDPQLQREVALKILRPRSKETATAKARFLGEARAAAKIHNDHVISIFQIGEDDGLAYVAMERLRGETLDERLNRAPIPLPDILRIAREIALGLAAAHAAGLIHRDIKPENIWLETCSDRVKILDFGLARPVEGDVFLTKAGTILGTPAFMAPEQAAGQRVDARSDLFSLGAVMYRMVTDRQPFMGDDVMAVLSALATEIPPRPRRFNPQTPARFDDLIMRLLAKSPADRPATAQRVAEEIAAIESDPDKALAWDRRKVLAIATLPVLGVAGYFALPKKESGVVLPTVAVVPPLRELRLPARATAFVGNFLLDPLRTCTIEAFITPETPAFVATEFSVLMGNDAIFVYGVDRTWNVAAKMLKAGGEAENIRLSAQAEMTPKRTHVAGVRFGNMMRIFIDGRPAGQHDIGHDWRLVDCKHFRLGQCLTPCRFDEVRVSTIPRYLGPFTPVERHEPDEHTFALYHCDETEGIIFTDSSGHGRHGTIHSGEWVATPRGG